MRIRAASGNLGALALWTTGVRDERLEEQVGGAFKGF